MIKNNRVEFYNYIFKYINSTNNIKALSECGNKINIYDTIDLYLGKKVLKY